jgi:hypothetical protein
LEYTAKVLYRGSYDADAFLRIMVQQASKMQVLYVFPELVV